MKDEWDWTGRKEEEMRVYWKSIRKMNETELEVNPQHSWSDPQESFFLFLFSSLFILSLLFLLSLLTHEPLQSHFLIDSRWGWFILRFLIPVVKRKKPFSLPLPCPIWEKRSSTTHSRKELQMKEESVFPRYGVKWLSWISSSPPPFFSFSSRISFFFCIVYYSGSVVQGHSS